MLTMNHTAVFLLTALRTFKKIAKGDKTYAMEMAEEYIDRNIALLLLPDAIRMYGPRQQFHFTEHPVSGRISGVKFNTTPDMLKGIKNAFEANLEPNIPKCVIDEMSHPEEFARINPEWCGTAYMTHLYQDCAWDKWLGKMVDVSARFEDKFVYKATGECVDGATYRKELGPIDNVFFQKIAKTIKEEFGILLDKEWYEVHVHAIMLEKYDEELAENTWKYINLPNIDEEIILPAYICKQELDTAVTKMIEATIPVLFI